MIHLTHCNEVGTIYEDKLGTVWVGTGIPFQGHAGCGGLNKLNKKTGSLLSICMRNKIRIALLITGFVPFLKTVAAFFG